MKRLFSAGILLAIGIGLQFVNLLVKRSLDKREDSQPQEQ